MRPTQVQVRLAEDCEILVKTTRGAIAAPLDARGWYRTGDLGRWDAAGRLEVVDRKGACVKLASGEFFRPQHAEAVFEARCPSIRACALVARVGDAAPTAVVASDASADAVLAEMRAAAAAAGLSSWEVPTAVVVSSVDGGSR